MSEDEQPERKSHPRPASMVMTRVGGVDYPLVSVAQCKTCQSPHRLIIENHLITGRSNAGIRKELEAIDPDGEHPTAEGIGEHYRKGHMPLNQAVKRRLIERRAEEIGKNMNAELETLMDHVTVAQMILQTGGEKVARGELDPNITETLAAAKFLFDIEKSAQGSVDNEMWTTAFMVYMEAARELMTEDQWQNFGRRLASHPVLREMAAKRDAIEANTIDAEVVEESEFS